MRRIVVAGLVALFSCGARVSVAADESSAAQFKKIALVRVAPPKVRVQNNGGAASALGGLIGAGVQGSVNQDNTKRYVTLLNERGLKPWVELAGAVVASLREKGYEAAYTPDQVPKMAADGKSVDYSVINTDADGILAVWYVSFGYVSESCSTNYDLDLVIGVRLLDAKTRTSVFNKVYKVANCMPAFSRTVVESPSSFESADLLMARFDDSVAGVTKAQQAVAAQIAADLGRR